MYVCLCNGYTDTEIKEVAEQGARSACEAYDALGGGFCCGKCSKHAKEIVSENFTALPLMAAE